MKRMKPLTVLLLLGLCAGPSLAQDTADGPTGFTFAGIPALNYNSDEGIGYGARASLYNHAEGGYNPYFSPSKQTSSSPLEAANNSPSSSTRRTCWGPTSGLRAK